MVNILAFGLVHGQYIQGHLLTHVWVGQREVRSWEVPQLNRQLARSTPAMLQQLQQ